MSLYIVRQKGALLAEAFPLHSRRLGTKDREKQIGEVEQIRTSDGLLRDVRAWLGNDKSLALQKDSSENAVTATKFVNLTREQAESLRKDVSGITVTADCSFELIRPYRNPDTAAGKVTKKNMWHLDAIKLASLRRSRQGFGRTGRGVTIAVLDTGVDASHPELKGRVSGASTFSVESGTALPMEPSRDTDGHGTHVAGLICGKDVGVAPEAKVVAGVMLPNGRGNLSDFIVAIEWAARLPEVRIVNLSAGIPGYLPEMREAMADLLAVGVLPVAAIGNEGRNRTRSPGNYGEVLSVGATNKENHVASFSSGGNIVADNHAYAVPSLVAPGQAVYSCVPGGGYEAWDGTSMAAPIVSGVATLMLQKYPKISVADLFDEILNCCTTKVFGAIDSDVRRGHGLVQVRR